jgi:hypothetical protein
MAEFSVIIAAVLSGVLVAALVFYVWGRRVERRATDPKAARAGRQRRADVRP